MCNQFKVKYGLLQDSEDVARQLNEEMRKKEVQNLVDQKAKEGKLETTMSVAEKRAAAAAAEEARKSKKKRKAKQANDQMYEDAFNFDISMIKMFGSIGIAPPTSSDDLDATIKAIQEKKQWFVQNGEAKRQEQIEEIKKMAKEQEKHFEETAKA